MLKPFFTLLLASVPLSVLSERKNTHRRLDNIYERIDALQYHVMVILTLLRIPLVIHTLRLVLADESGWACCCRGCKI